VAATAKRAAARWADRDWEQLGRRDPYFAVLTDDDYRGDALSPERRQRFFATGEGHVAALFAAVSEVIGEPFRPHRALDFGCGVGRVLGALAARCERVVGADVAASMLAEARRVGAAAGWANVDLVQVDDELAALAGDFDLIHSAMVLQHVETRRGERLAPGTQERLLR